jgi:hypothetical protein
MMRDQGEDDVVVAGPEIFARWMTDTGFSRNDAARALGVTTDSIRNYEGGDARLKRHVRLAMAAILAGLAPYGE